MPDRRQTQTPTGLRIGFVSTRFAGTDGVSLETSKWVKVLEKLGHHCFYFAGKLDTPPERSRLAPEAFWEHPEIAPIQEAAFHLPHRPPAITTSIHRLAARLKEQLYAFLNDFQIELLVVQNALAIPMNIPLGIALTELIGETGIPTIAHHHDFFWERKRFLTNCVWDYLNMAFPCTFPSVRHVVINSSGRHQLGTRTGVAAMLIPNVMDFANPPPPPDSYACTLREELGIAPDEYFILQPTRVVQRKGIEHAIELMHRLELLGIKARLVISHASGDEGNSYEQRVRDFAALLRVNAIFVAEQIDEQRGTTITGRPIFTLADAYSQADLVTYPSAIEGFGNAFLEAIYFRRPIVVNAYSIYSIDIKPKGFEVIEFDGYVTDECVRQTRQFLEQPALVQEIADRNYALAERYYSFGILAHSLQTLIADLFGVNSPRP